MRTTFSISIFIRICGTLISLIGLLVAIGWIIQSPILVQLSTSLAPMYFNTALCFMICGVILLLINTYAAMLTRILAVIVGMIGLIIGSEYLFNINYGIDTFFIKPFIYVQNSFPGRMAPSTLINFVLASIAFLLCINTHKTLKSSRVIIITLLGSLIGSFGIVALLGYLSGTETHQIWGGLAQMALHAAVCFVILGLAIVLYAYDNAKSMPVLLPIPIFIGITIAAIYMGHSIKLQEEINFTQFVQREASHTVKEFAQYQNDMYAALNRMKLRWEKENGATQALWESDASAYIQDYPTLQALAWVNKDFRVTWVMPSEKYKGFIGYRYDTEAKRAAAMHEALRTRSAKTTKAINLLSDGSKGFVYINPLFVNHQYDGLLIAIFNTADLLNYLFKQNLFGKYYLSVNQEGTFVFNNLPLEETWLKKWSETASVTINHKIWTFTLTPTKRTLADNTSNVYILVPIAGLFISLIIAFAIFFWLKVKKNAEALKRSEQRLHLATTGTSDGLWDWNVITNETYYSPRCLEMLGYQEHELPFSIETFMNLLHPDDHALINKNVNAHFQNHTLYNVECRLKHKAGYYIWCNSRGQATWDKNGKPIRMTGFVTDITERKQAQAEIKKTKDRLQAIMDASSHSIIATGLDGSIQLFNRAAERMLGYRAEEMIGQTPAVIHTQQELIERSRTLSKLLGREITPGFETFVARLKTQEVDEQEWTYVRKDGSTFPVWLSISALHSDNKEIEGYMGIAQDISERKALDAMKNEFISIVSHELRTPLTSIRGALGLLVGGAIGNFDEKTQKILNIAYNNCKRLIRLINDILDVEKIEAGKVELQLMPVNLSALAEEAVAANLAYAEKFNVSIKLVTASPDIFVNADGDRLMQVFTNLLSNAIKFSPKESTVVVNICFQNDKAVIAVTDKGPGIPDAFQNHIFEKFAQADSTSVRKQGGTGLGLSITKSIVEKLSGRIYFVTEINQGTTFYVDLPAWLSNPNL